MDRLFDETFVSEENNIASRNIWYGYVELYVTGEYGKQIVLDEELVKLVCKIVKDDTLENKNPAPTEINWYLYGKSKTTDAIEDTIRPTIMIRSKQGQFVVRCNISDHDFALHIDDVLQFENYVVELLKK